MNINHVILCNRNRTTVISQNLCVSIPLPHGANVKLCSDNLDLYSEWIKETGSTVATFFEEIRIQTFL